MRLVVRDGALATRYEDARVPLLEVLGSPTYRRSSHINPSADGKAFVIDWLEPAVVAALGQHQTTTDARGEPFRTKGAAEQYEVALLERYYFGHQKELDYDEVSDRAEGGPVS